MLYENTLNPKPAIVHQPACEEGDEDVSQEVPGARAGGGGRFLSGAWGRLHTLRVCVPK